jgi:hypothetical protein
MLLRLAAFAVFGPITAFFSERAAVAFLKGEPGRGALMIALNVLVVGSIPAVTAALLSARL